MRLRRRISSTIISFHRCLHSSKSPDRTRDEIIQDRQNSFSWYQKHIYRPHQHFTYDPCSWSREAEERCKTPLPFSSRLQTVRDRRIDEDCAEAMNRKHKMNSVNEKKNSQLVSKRGNEDPTLALHSPSHLELVRKIEELTEYLESYRFAKYTTEQKRQNLIKKREMCILQLFYQWIRTVAFSESLESSDSSGQEGTPVLSLKSHLCIWCLLLQHKEILMVGLQNDMIPKGRKFVDGDSNQGAKTNCDLTGMTQTERNIKVDVERTEGEGDTINSSLFPFPFDDTPTLLAQISESVIKRVFLCEYSNRICSLPLESLIELFSIVTHYYSFKNETIKKIRTKKTATTLREDRDEDKNLSTFMVDEKSSDHIESYSTSLSESFSLKTITRSLLLSIIHSLSDRQRRTLPVLPNTQNGAEVLNSGEIRNSPPLAVCSADPLYMNSPEENSPLLNEQILSSLMVQLFSESLWRLWTVFPSQKGVNASSPQNVKNEADDLALLQLFCYRKACQLVKSKAESMTYILKHSLPSPPSQLHQLRAVANADSQEDSLQRDIPRVPPFICFPQTMRMIRKNSPVVTASSSMNIPCRGRGVQPLTNPEETTLLLESITYVVWMSSLLFSTGSPQGQKMDIKKKSMAGKPIAEVETLQQDNNAMVHLLLNSKGINADALRDSIKGRKLFEECFEKVMEALYFTPNYDLPPGIVVLFCSMCLEENGERLLWEKQRNGSPSTPNVLEEEELECRVALQLLDNLYHILLLLSRLEVQLHVSEKQLCRLFFCLTKRSTFIIENGEKMLAMCSAAPPEVNEKSFGSKWRLKNGYYEKDLLQQRKKWLPSLEGYVKECKRLQGITIGRILFSSSVQAKHFYMYESCRNSEDRVQFLPNTDSSKMPWEIHFCCYTRIRIPNRLWIDACRYRGVWPLAICRRDSTGKKQSLSCFFSSECPEREQSATEKQTRRHANEFAQLSKANGERKTINSEVYAALIEMRSRSTDTPLNVASAQCILRCLSNLTPEVVSVSFSLHGNQREKRILFETDWERVWSQFSRLTYTPAISSLLQQTMKVLSESSQEEGKVVAV